MVLACNQSQLPSHRWAGLRDGICFHRCIVYFVHNERIMVSEKRRYASNK